MNKSISTLFFCLVSFLLFSSSSLAQSRRIDSLKLWIDTHKTIDSQYILSLHRMSYWTSENDVETSFKYYELVNRYSEELNFTYGRALAQINLGILLSTSANYEGSIEAYLMGMDLADSCNALRLKSVCLNNIGDNFFSLNEYDKCRDYSRRAIAINRKLNAWRGVALNYELLLQCDLKEQKYDEAKAALDSGYHYALISGESYILALFHLGYGKYESVKGDQRNAESYFDKAMNEAIAGNELRNKYKVYIAKTEFLHNLSDVDKRRFLDSAFLIANETRYLKGINKSSQLLSQYYEQKKNVDSTLKYFGLYRNSLDTMFSENNRRNIIIRESDWMIRRKEIENKSLKQIAEIQKSEISFKNLLLIAAAILFLAMVTVVVFMYKNLKASRHRQVSEFEKKIIQVKMESLQAQMNPHFIFNCLNSIENFVIKNDRLEASRYLNKFSSLIRLILESSSSDSIPFEKDFSATQIYVELERLRFNNKFAFVSDIDPRLMNPDLRVPPLFLQPYVENAILHGIAPSENDNLRLTIRGYIDQGYLNFEVEDNGIGRKLSEEYKEKTRNGHKSLGIYLTKEKLDIFSQRFNIKTDIKIYDLYSDQGPQGTRVVLRIEMSEALKHDLYETKSNIS